MDLHADGVVGGLDLWVLENKEKEAFLNDHAAGEVVVEAVGFGTVGLMEVSPGLDEGGECEGQRGQALGGRGVDLGLVNVGLGVGVFAAVAGVGVHINYNGEEERTDCVQAAELGGLGLLLRGGEERAECGAAHEHYEVRPGRQPVRALQREQAQERPQTLTENYSTSSYIKLLEAFLARPVGQRRRECRVLLNVNEASAREPVQIQPVAEITRQVHDVVSQHIVRPLHVARHTFIAHLWRELRIALLTELPGHGEALHRFR